MRTTPTKPPPAMIASMEETKTKIIAADEMRAGYEVVRDDGSRMVVARVRHLVNDHVVVITWRSPEDSHRRYKAVSRDHQFRVALEDYDF